MTRRCTPDSDWDGSTWTAEPIRGHPGKQVQNGFEDVSLDSASHGWTVGEWDGPHHYGLLLEEYDGSGWTVACGPGHDVDGNPFAGTACSALRPASASRDW